MNGSDHTSTLGKGRVEICYNNSYWSVCDDRWDILDAIVVCKQLDERYDSEVIEHRNDFGIISVLFSASVPVRRSMYGNSTVPFLLDNVVCTGNETTLLECIHSGLGMHNCDSSETAGVVCGGTSLFDSVVIILLFSALTCAMKVHA